MKIQTRVGSLKGERGTFVSIKAYGGETLGTCLRKLVPNVITKFSETEATIFLYQTTASRLASDIKNLSRVDTEATAKCETCGKARTLYSVNKFLVCLQHSPFWDVGSRGYIDEAGVARASKAARAAKNTAKSRKRRAARAGRPLRKFSYVTAKEKDWLSQIQKSVNEQP